MKKIIIYARVSTIMQDERDSLEYQIKKCVSYCEMHDLNCIKIIKDVESGGKDDRNGFLELKQELEKKELYAIVVYETSRISRITRTLINFIYELEKKEVKFISISQPELNTTSHTGMLFFQIQASLAEYERKQISTRVKSNLYQRAKDGKWLGGVSPLGYDAINKKLIINDVEADIVRDIFYSYIDSGSLNTVAKKYKKPLESIRWILKNYIYIGKKSYGKKERNISTGITKIKDTCEIFEGEHEAIIDDDTFNEARRLMEFNRTKVLNTRGSRVKLFTSLLHCECGGKYHSTTSKSGNGTTYFYYRCTYCKKKFNADFLEENILNAIINFSELSELNEFKDNLLDSYIEKENYLKRKLSSLQNSKNKLIKIYTNDIITEEEFNSNIKEIKDNISRTLEEIETNKELIDNANNKQTKVDNVKLFKEIMRNLDVEDREEAKKIFRLMIDKIIINKGNIEISIIHLL